MRDMTTVILLVNLLITTHEAPSRGEASERNSFWRKALFMRLKLNFCGPDETAEHWHLLLLGLGC